MSDVIGCGSLKSGVHHYSFNNTSTNRLAVEDSGGQSNTNRLIQECKYHRPAETLDEKKGGWL
ncbi:MAG: hypothetical protein WBN95_03055 [Gammaproteobacteria bacterium]